MSLCCIFQIEKIRNVIELTKANLERLNAEFGSERHPPAIYLQVCGIHFLIHNT